MQRGKRDITEWSLVIKYLYFKLRSDEKKKKKKRKFWLTAVISSQPMQLHQIVAFTSLRSTSKWNTNGTGRKYMKDHSVFVLSSN